MNFHHSSRCPAPHTECVCGANDAMLIWADRQTEQAADQLDKETHSWG